MNILFEDFINESKKLEIDNLKNYRFIFRNPNEMVEIAKLLKNIGLDVYNYEEIIKNKRVGNKTNFKWNGQRFNRSNLPYNEIENYMTILDLKKFLKEKKTNKELSKNLKTYTITFDNIKEMKEEIRLIMSSGYKVKDYNNLLNKKDTEGYDCLIWSLFSGAFIRSKKFLLTNKINLEELENLLGKNSKDSQTRPSFDPFAEEDWIPIKEASQYGNFAMPTTSEEELTNYYICDDCGKNFYVFNEETPICKCGSSNITQISDFDYFANLKKYSDKEKFNKEMALKRKRESGFIELNYLNDYKRVKNYRKTIS